MNRERKAPDKLAEPMAGRITPRAGAWALPPPPWPTIEVRRLTIETRHREDTS